MAHLVPEGSHLREVLVSALRDASMWVAIRGTAEDGDDIGDRLEDTLKSFGFSRQDIQRAWVPLTDAMRPRRGESVDDLEIRCRMFGLSNALKRITGLAATAIEPRAALQDLPAGVFAHWIERDSFRERAMDEILLMAAQPGLPPEAVFPLARLMRSVLIHNWRFTPSEIREALRPSETMTHWPRDERMLRGLASLLTHLTGRGAL